MMNNVISIILGGGAGSRLFPLTRDRSKPAVPLAGKYRLIDIPISNSINSGINRILVLTQYNSASLNRHVTTTYRFSRFSQGFVQIIAAEQTPSSAEWFQGTADAVRQSMPHMTVHRHTHVLILSGDQLYQMDYSRMYAHHVTHDAQITIATIPVTAQEATGFGILKTDDSHRIVKFVEKPTLEELEDLRSAVTPELEEQGRVYLASMGIYLFDCDVLEQELADTKNHTDFGKEVIPESIARRQVVSYPFDGYWSDIGTIRSFYDANLALAQRVPAFDLYSTDMPVYTNPRMLPAAKIQSSYIQDSLIAEACIIINSHISNSVIGIRSYIGYNTTIKNSVIMGNDFFPWHERARRSRGIDAPERPGIENESYVENAIVDKNVSIGMHCVIKNQEGIQEGEGSNFYIRDGIVILPKNVHIPDGTII